MACRRAASVHCPLPCPRSFRCCCAQKRTSGTLGFTLRDEWRFLSYKKEPFLKPEHEEQGFVNLTPLAPQVVNPYDKAWDLEFAPMCKFSEADLEARLPAHIAFRASVVQVGRDAPRARAHARSDSHPRR